MINQSLRAVKKSPLVFVLIATCVATLPLSASAYFNALTNSATFAADFTSYSSGGGSFGIDQVYGLQLTSVAPDAMEGIQAYNTRLSASQDWIVNVRVHVSAFTNGQVNPFYRAGLVCAKAGADFDTTAQNVVNLHLERSSSEGQGVSMSNSIASVWSVGGVEASSEALNVGQNEDFYLRLFFRSADKTLERSFSSDGISYTSLALIDLAANWGLSSQDELVLALVGTALAYDGETPTYSVSSGEIYLRDVNVVPDLNADSDGDGLTDAWELGFGRYQVIEGSFSWDSAKADAQVRGGHLATITSQDESDFVYRTFGATLGDGQFSHTWLGGTDSIVEGSWEWVTGERWLYTRWGDGEPNGGSADNCLALFNAVYSGHAPGLTWNDDTNYEGRRYLLEFGYPTDPSKADTDADGFNDKVETDLRADPNDSSVTPNTTDSDGDGLTDAWELGFGRYQVVRGSFTWEQARLDAENNGGHLATVTTPEEWAFIREIFTSQLNEEIPYGGSRVLLGASDQEAEGVWKWVTGEQWSNMDDFWWSSNPSNDGGVEHYMELLNALYQGHGTDMLFVNDISFFFSSTSGYLLEFGYPSDPFNPDSDGDGFNDKLETDAGTDPNNVVSNPNTKDTDGEGVNDYREVKDGTDPNDQHSFNPLSKGLTAYYQFNGNAHDESGYGYDFQAAPFLFFGPDRHGAETNAVSFTSNPPIYTLPFQNSPTTTVSFWLKLTAVPSTYGERVLLNGSFNVQWTDDNSATFGFAVWHNGQFAVSWLNKYRTGQEIVLPPGTLTINQWYQVFLTADGSTVGLGLNGKVLSSVEGSLLSVRQPISLGGESDYYFDSGLIDDLRVYSRSLTEAELKQLFYAEALGEPERQFLMENPSLMGHYGQSEFDANRTNGQTDVTTNPSAFDLFTAEQLTANYSNGVAVGTALVLSNPASYNLYTSDSIMDLRMDGLMIQKQGSNAIVSFQPQTTTDLTLPFTNNGTPITSEIPMPGNKGFIRIQANPGPTPLPPNL